MFRVICFIVLVCAINASTISEEPKGEEISKALSVFTVSVGKQHINGTQLGTEWCSYSTTCGNGFHCCSTTTCCPNNRKCCGGGRMCCTYSGSSISRSTVGLTLAAVLLYFGKSMLLKIN